MAYDQVQDHDNALKSFQRKFVIQQQHYEENHMDIIRTLFQIVHLHLIMRSHSYVIIECSTQALTLYDSSQRLEETQEIQSALIQMIFFESMRMKGNSPIEQNNCTQ